MKHGKGKWTRIPGQKGNFYEGSYLKDQKHGTGYFQWKSGNSYSGNYKYDERSGYGVMRWTDESIYMGLWENGI